MKDLRSRIAIAAVIFGLGGLGGFAMGSNPAGHQQVPGAAVTASHTSQSGPRVSTGTSGAVSTPVVNAPASQTLAPPSALGRGGRDD